MVACVSLTHSLTSVIPFISHSFLNHYCGVHEILGESERSEMNQQKRTKETQRMVKVRATFICVQFIPLLSFIHSTVPFPAFSVPFFLSSFYFTVLLLTLKTECLEC